MNSVCGRRGATAAALERPPLPTTVGREVQARTRLACWQEWLCARTILIDEHRLTLVDAAARKALEEQMRSFLSLPEATAR